MFFRELQIGTHRNGQLSTLFALVKLLKVRRRGHQRGGDLVTVVVEIASIPRLLPLEFQRESETNAADAAIL